MSEKTKIITHRGLEPSRGTDFPGESTLEAFSDHLNRFDGIEFDPKVLADGQVVVSHDLTLSRVTQGRDVRALAEISLAEFLSVKTEKGRLATFDEILTRIEKSKTDSNAIHLKGSLQDNQAALNAVIDVLLRHEQALRKCFIFDVKPNVAEYLKKATPSILLSPSVAHPYDIERYGACVGNTLLSLEEVLRYRHLYSLVWLDEWDLVGCGSQKKKFYTAELFEELRKADFRIALVTPELHATSPGLLGGESHADAKTQTSLMGRIEEILSLKPDAICTDWPQEVKTLRDKQ